MKTFSSKLSVLATVIAMVGITTAGSADEVTLNQIAGYRQWTKINAEPVKVEVATSAIMSLVGS